ncbi:GNAT family N-acetyltransferase [Aliiruegeria sabulilitoris]|uniref:GNAT family N-acetyltransferase n=1 Tax=Aliiruegeria sabulilitoris TaxID=1510458 RepID=UPI0009EAE4BB|nr:GNAT family N-acetyltransferase [Aliiruegeria sabulilitoris]NDR55594.1 GNAT family N-acetyltransferase [Pseudoruegeria sp. M32A2M]
MSITPAGTEIQYTVTWLEMTERPSYGWPHEPTGEPASLLKADTPPAWFFLMLYDAVGRDYAWEDMHDKTEDELSEWLADPATSLYTLMRKGWPHGFFMLDHRKPSICHLAYFGLVPQAIGRGLGRFLLQNAVLTAWDLPGVKKLTVNTNTLDHPRALQTYQRCGFDPVLRTEHRRVLKRDVDASRIPD